MFRQIRANLVQLQAPLPSELMRALKPPAQKIHLAICISMTREPYSAFLKTLKSILRNVRMLCELFEGFSAENIVIFLIQDGFQNITGSFLETTNRRIIHKENLYTILARQRMRSMDNKEIEDLSSRDNYARGNDLSEQREINGRQSVLSCTEKSSEFETRSLHCSYTKTTLFLFTDSKDRREIQDLYQGQVPEICLVYGIKDKSRGERDTHRFFFEGFCNPLNPRYCVLLQSGTTFNDNAFYGFVQLGQIRSSLAGVASEVETNWQCVPLVMAQFLDYKIAQITTSAEALHGSVQIIPETHQFLKWSSVRGKPLQILSNQRNEAKPENSSSATASPSKNVFITTLLLTRDDKVHTIQYLPGVRSYIDVPRCTSDYLEERVTHLNQQFAKTFNSLNFLCHNYHSSKVKETKPCFGGLLFFQLFYYFARIFVNTNITVEIFTFVVLCSNFQSSFLSENSQITKMPDPLPSYSVCIFILFSCLTVLISLFCGYKSVCVSIFYELLGLGFLLLNIFKLLAIISTIAHIFNQFYFAVDTGLNLTLQITLVTLALFYPLMHVLALCLIRPRDFCSKFFKYLLGFLSSLLLSHTLYYMASINLMFNLSFISQEGKRRRPLYKLFKFLMLLGWLGIQSSILVVLFMFQDQHYLCFALVILVMIWNCSRISEAMVYWCCRYQCHIRSSLYGPLRKYIKSLKQSQESPQSSTRRALARCGSNMSATSATNKSQESNDSISKGKNIPHIKSHQRVPSFQTALDSIKEVDFRQELTYRLNDVLELSFNKETSRNRFNSSPNHSPQSPLEARWSMIQSPFVLTNEIRIEGLEGAEDQVTDNSLALTSMEEGQIDEEASPTAPRDIGIRLERRKSEQLRERRREMTPTATLRSGRGSSMPALLQQCDFTKKRASLTHLLSLKSVKETNEDLEEDTEEKEEHTAPETQNDNYNEDSEEESSPSDKDSPKSPNFEGSELWNGSGISEPALQKKNNLGDK